jgi:hypothetical protein
MYCIKVAAATHNPCFEHVWLPAIGLSTAAVAAGADIAQPSWVRPVCYARADHSQLPCSFSLSSTQGGDVERSHLHAQHGTCKVLPTLLSKQATLQKTTIQQNCLK